jgi:hypothetical protein
MLIMLSGFEGMGASAVMFAPRAADPRSSGREWRVRRVGQKKRRRSTRSLTRS